MSLLLSVYSQLAYKEYILPTIQNGEVEFYLKKGLFGLKNDLTIKAESVEGRWFFLPGEASIERNGISCLGQEICTQDSFVIITTEQEHLYMLAESVSNFLEGWEKYSLKRIDQIRIGSGERSDIFYTFMHRGRSYISEPHAELKREGENWILSDKSSNGTFLNNKRLSESCVLEYGDRINLWGLNLVYLKNVLAISGETNGGEARIGLEKWENVCEREALEKKDGLIAEKQEFYHRSPREVEPLDTELVEIEGPPAPKGENSMPLVMQIGPALTMMLPMVLGSGLAIISSRMSGSVTSGFMYTGLITAGCSGSLGAFWTYNNIKYAKKRREEEEKRRIEIYSQYLTKCEERIKKSYERNCEILKICYPSSKEIVEKTYGSMDGMWGRNIYHDDFLYHRLGIGNLPFQAPVSIPKERFSMVQDELSQKPRILKETYENLRCVPVGIDLLKQNLIGISGGENKVGADSVIYNLVVQIATQNCYTDVKMVFISSGGDWEERWKFALWFPHVWSENKKIRFVAYDSSEAGEVLFALTEVLRRRFEAQNGVGVGSQKIPLPYYILFVEDESLISGELIEKYIYNREKNLGLTTVFLAERQEELPNQCECVIRNDGIFSGIWNVKQKEKIQIQFDTVIKEQVDTLARRMSFLKVNERETGGEIPDSVTFFEMYGVGSPEELRVPERWRRNRTYSSMRALIGIKSGGEKCYLDLHEKYHGPHGLVAGTTGSGKSETIQTYILSLALNFSPDDVGFLIIDYKGGGMGNLFAKLPHVLGQISNLSGNQIRRAMVSIKSENLRRQRVFNEYGVNHIDLYTKLYKNGEANIPIPHLFIVIDEFAELKREEPEFMRELISVAQVGRSLGVHLILATQKPAGTVDDNIWSNAKFRLCLRVQDRQDSMDMLHKPDAAYLTGVGKGYLQVGNDEIYEQFQSGWSGAEYDKESGTGQAILARMLTSSGKTAVIGNHEASKNKGLARARWILKLIRELESVSGQIGNQKQVDLVDGLEEQFLKEWQKQLETLGLEYLNCDHGKRLLKNLMILYEEAQEKEKDVDWIIEQAQRRNWKLPEQKKLTQLDALVEYLAKITASEVLGRQQPLWLPLLPGQISLFQVWRENAPLFDGTGWPECSGQMELETEIGLYDDPANQMQEPLVLNFTEDGNHAVFGLPMSGKSTLLQTAVFGILKRYSPQYVNLYLLDFGNRMLEPFEKAPQTGGILYENDLEQVGKLLHMLERILIERKQRFRGGNFSQYIIKHGPVCPAILVVIDNMAAFREKTESVYDERILKLSRECASVGIYLLISGSSYGTSEIPLRMKDSIRRTICLELQDKYQYVDLFNTIKIDVLPESGAPGRGLTKIDERILEFQTCVAVGFEDDYSRSDAIEKECIRMAQCWKQETARPIPHIPEKPQWADFLKWQEVEHALCEARMLPIGYEEETADLYSVDLSNTYCYLISGRARTGKTNLLRIMMRIAALKGARIAVVEFGASELQNEANELNADYVTSHDEYYSLMTSLLPEFQERNREKQELRLHAAEDEVIFEQMSQRQPYFIFISDLAEFSRTMYGQEGSERGFAEFTTNILEKGSQLNIYFIACLNHEKQAEVQIHRVFRAFTGYQTGVHLGGYEDAQRLLKFSGLSIRQMGMMEPAGHGYTAQTERRKSVKVVIPLAKG